MYFILDVFKNRRDLSITIHHDTLSVQHLQKCVAHTLLEGKTLVSLGAVAWTKCGLFRIDVYEECDVWLRKSFIGLNCPILFNTLELHTCTFAME